MTYAIFATGGAQFRAEPGVTIKDPAARSGARSKVTFDRVLLASDASTCMRGSRW